MTNRKSYTLPFPFEGSHTLSFLFEGSYTLSFPFEGSYTLSFLFEGSYTIIFFAPFASKGKTSFAKESTLSHPFASFTQTKCGQNMKIFMNKHL